MLRRLSTSAPRWHVAVVGSGPAGWYAADNLLKACPHLRVDIYERLPVPFGLVRYGVAPDHQTVKNVTKRFAQIAEDPRCRLIGNVSIGMPPSSADGAYLSLDTLRKNYNAVLLSYGASADRRLGVPGEELAGVCGARSFVEWYNGHPAALPSQFDLSKVERVVIIGNGNVALDCARLLCATKEELVGSDVAEYAAAELARSSVREVVLLARRGPLQAAFTIKELRELTKRAGCKLTLEVRQGSLSADCSQLLTAFEALTHVAEPSISSPNHRRLNHPLPNTSAGADAFSEEVMKAAAQENARKRLVELMKKVADSPTDNASAKTIRLQFQRAPKAFLPAVGQPNSLGAVQIVQTALEDQASTSQRAHMLEGSEYELPCELAMRAVGYRSTPIEGAPFDDKRGIVPNSMGRVQGASGLYVAGWLKRGPNGVILTNVNDANETALAVLEDRKAGLLEREVGGGDAVRPLLLDQGKPIIDFEGWLRMDAEEMRRGSLANKAREKILSTSEMLHIAGCAESSA
ncbi:MAG: hypothetical protein SGPRY_004621 [Prymnesium sp.]